MTTKRILPGSARAAREGANGPKPDDVTTPVTGGDLSAPSAGELAGIDEEANVFTAPSSDESNESNEGHEPEKAGESDAMFTFGESPAAKTPSSDATAPGEGVVSSPTELATLSDEDEEPARHTSAGDARRNGLIRPGAAREAIGAQSPEPAPPAGSVEPAPPPHRGVFWRLYYGETKFDFVRRRRTWFAISAAIILAGIISLSTQGLNLGIEFAGGTSWTVQTRTATVAQAENALRPLGLGGATITVLGTNSQNSRTLNVEAKLPKGQTPKQQQTEANQVATALARLTHKSSLNEVSIESVGPSWGGQITQKAIYALAVFFVMIALYISIFFEWRMALAAIIAVAHDILVTVGIYSLTGLQVTPDTVVAFLTILGYSLYDTIVVFDRVRDNTKNLSIRDRLTYSDVVNLSMNQTLARSINTSLVAVMPILAVLVLGAEILGATTLQYFGLALLVGLTTGAYSSIFIASPLVAVMKEREPRYRQLRERLAARGGDHTLVSPAMLAAGFGPTGESSARPTPESRPSRPPARRPSAARRPTRTRAKGGRR